MTALEPFTSAVPVSVALSALRPSPDPLGRVKAVPPLRVVMDGVAREGVQHVLGGVGAHTDELAEGARGSRVGLGRAGDDQTADRDGGREGRCRKARRAGGAH
jgi:hypothetical protein